MLSIAEAMYYDICNLFHNMSRRSFSSITYLDVLFTVKSLDTLLSNTYKPGL